MTPRSHRLTDLRPVDGSRANAPPLTTRVAALMRRCAASWPQLLMVELELPAALLMTEKFARASW